MLQAEAGPRRGPRGGDLILHRVQSKQVKFQQISAGDMNLGRLNMSFFVCLCMSMCVFFGSGKAFCT